MTKELKELVYFGLKVGELVEKLGDGFQLADLGKVIDAGKAAVPGILGATEALAEYRAMTDAEAVELEDYIKANFSISDQVVEQAIEEALNILIKLRSLADLLKVS